MKFSIPSTEGFTFSEHISNRSESMNSPSRFSSQLAIHLAIDNVAGKEFCEVVFPIHPFELRLIRTKQTSQIDEAKSLTQGNDVYLTTLDFLCVSPNGAERCISIVSDHPRFDDFRTFLQALF